MYGQRPEFIAVRSYFEADCDRGVIELLGPVPAILLTIGKIDRLDLISEHLNDVCQKRI